MKKRPEVIPTTHPESEADRFIDFARKLMSVPKKEIDKKQAEYERAKPQAKKRERIIVGR